MSKAPALFRWILLPLLATPAGLAQPGPGRVRTLSEVGKAHGLGLPGATNALVSLCSEDHRLSFVPGSRRLLLDGLLLYMNGPTVSRGRDWTISDCDAVTVVGALLGAGRPYRASRPLTVVLDPGHGGADSGALGHHRVVEKAVVLDIARFVRRQLHGCGARVRLTRNGDADLGLSQRAKLAASWSGDLLVSIHVNSAPNAAASGVETFVLPSPGFPSTSGHTNSKHRYPGNRHDAANTRLAYYIQKGLVSRTGAPDRGVKRARFQVLREAPCPAVLVECGFAANPAEARKLSSGRYRQQLATGIAQGILTFISRGVED